ncbi:MAG: ABC transporter ATP-binding protein, partial [Nitrospirota bacterium]|nr:ABC transporter ATP-binding protein [Nitrospirota bacterium]
EKKDLKELPGRIEALEAEREKLYESLADPDFYRQDGNRIPAARARIEELEKDITEAYEQWDLLETILKAS